MMAVPLDSGVAMLSTKLLHGPPETAESEVANGRIDIVNWVYGRILGVDLVDTAVNRTYRRIAFMPRDGEQGELSGAFGQQMGLFLEVEVGTAFRAL